MRKAILLFFLLLGIGLGLLSALKEDWGVKLVMMVIGAMFGSAIGGGLAQIGKPYRNGRRLLTEEEINPIPGGGCSGRDIAANYWRDKGQPPYTRMPDIELGKHVEP